jgi:hypothetical protein
MTNDHLSFSDYSLVTEALDLDIGDVKRDHQMETLAKMLLPTESHDSLRVLYNHHMKDNDLRVIKFKNPEGHVEYHIHNMQMMPGLKSSNVSKLGFMSAARLIHDDGLSELNQGNSLHFQGLEGSPQNAKYKNIIDRLAAKSGRKVTDAGIKPITTAPFLRGQTYLVEMTTDAGDIDSDKMSSDLKAVIEQNKRNRVKIGEGHYSIKLGNGNTIVYHHDKDHGNHSISLFGKIGSTQLIGQLNAVKAGYPDASHIYKNMQHMLDSHSILSSDSSQTAGGRRLWKNIHNYVNFGSAYKLHMTEPKQIQVKDFSDLDHHQPDPYFYVVAK